MKTSLALIAASAWPILSLAQTPALPAAAESPAPPAAPAIAESPAAPAADASGGPEKILDRVEFQGADLQAVIDFLKEKNQKLGGNPRDLNVVISPGLEKMAVPALSLRNVSVTDVLTVATTVLGLQVEAVNNNITGEPVAWLVKAPEPEQDAPVALRGVMVPRSVMAPQILASGGGADATVAVDPAPVAVDPLVASGSGPANRAEVVELASSPGSAGRPARPVSRVFGIASIVRSTKVNSEEREVEMRKNYLMLIESLERFAKEQEQETSVKFYPDMQIVVVKSQDPAALALMAEVIEAMKANAASH